ncbi:MAG: hypothetical protein LBB45_09755 [Methanobrevibacter sp.]|jgi:hypothetical protein|nr:hypothetical protein [Candidatus Methanovirga basalitermitum]
MLWLKHDNIKIVDEENATVRIISGGGGGGSIRCEWCNYKSSSSKFI